MAGEGLIALAVVVAIAVSVYRSKKKWKTTLMAFCALLAGMALYWDGFVHSSGHLFQDGT